MYGTRPLWYWLIVRCQQSRMEVLTIRVKSHGEALPVFSFEDEARLFLEYGDFDDGWQTRTTSCGELASVLLGACAQVESVALDPFPETDGWALASLTCMKRKGFVERLLQRSNDDMRVRTTLEPACLLSWTGS